MMHFCLHYFWRLKDQVNNVISVVKIVTYSFDVHSMQAQLELARVEQVHETIVFGTEINLNGP